MASPSLGSVAFPLRRLGTPSTPISSAWISGIRTGRLLLADASEQSANALPFRGSGRHLGEDVGLNLPEDQRQLHLSHLILGSDHLRGRLLGNQGGGVPGIMRSTDSGKTWVRLTSSVGGASAPLHAVRRHDLLDHRAGGGLWRRAWTTGRRSRSYPAPTSYSRRRRVSFPTGASSCSAGIT